MKEWKASEKEAQKMTRDGAISVNMVTGEASHVSDRAPEQDYSSSGDSTAFVRSAAERLDDRRIHKSEKKKAPETAQILPGGYGGQRPSILPFAVLKRGTLRAGTAKSDPQV